jgi:hypothetical protein
MGGVFRRPPGRKYDICTIGESGDSLNISKPNVPLMKMRGMKGVAHVTFKE